MWKLWNQSGYPVLVLNSLITTTLTVAICLLTGTIASYAFSRFAFPGRTQLMLSYLIVRMFPAVLMIIPLFIVMKNVGLLDIQRRPRGGLHELPAAAVRVDAEGLLRCGAQVNSEAAARIDGSTRIGAMFRIVHPDRA